MRILAGARARTTSRPDQISRRVNHRRRHAARPAAPPHTISTKAGSGTGVGMKFSSSAEPVLATVNVPPFRFVKSAPETVPIIGAPMIDGAVAIFQLYGCEFMNRVDPRLV